MTFAAKWDRTELFFIQIYGSGPEYTYTYTTRN